MTQISKVQEFFDIVMSSENLTIKIKKDIMDRTVFHISPTDQISDYCIAIRGDEVSVYADEQACEYLKKHHNISEELFEYIDQFSGMDHAIALERLDNHKLYDYLLLQEMK